MKKLMILGAAVLSGAVVFGIESANIVGYNGSALDNDYGAVMTGPQFLSVGGGNFCLTNLNLVSEADVAGSVTIQTLNNWGGQDETTEEYTWNGTGWEDSYGAPVSGVKFAPGKGLWVYNFTGEAVGFHMPAPEL